MNNFFFCFREDDESTATDEEMPDNEQLNIKKKKCVYRWRKVKPPVFDNTFHGDQFTLSPTEDATLFDYFKIFGDDEITKNLCQQTNLYNVQKFWKCINTTFQEIEQFIGVQMSMSLVSLPSYDMYWSNKFTVLPIQ